MQPRLDYAQVDAEALQLWANFNRFAQNSGLEHSLLELVKIRASQLNGCAFCIDMHTKDARLAGESEQRIYALSAWQETPFFNLRERAALAWTEAITLISSNNVPDELYQSARQEFSEKELVDLTYAIISINGWNRLAIAFRKEPGSYQPKQSDAMGVKQEHK